MVSDYLLTLNFILRYFILVYTVLFFNNTYFYSFANLSIFFSFRLDNISWYYLCIMNILSIITLLVVYNLLTSNVIKSIEFFLSLNFFFLCVTYLLLINNLVSLIFILELQSVIFMFMMSSFHSLSNNFIHARSQYLLNQQIWYFNSLIYQFWVSFIGSLLLIYSSLNFFKLSGFMDWSSLNIFFFFSSISWLDNLSLYSCLNLALFLFSVFIKIGFFPFFLWKPEIYKNLNFLTLFLYMTTYLFGIVFFLLVLFYNYLSLLLSYTYNYVYLLSVLSFLVFPLFLYSISEVRPFLGYSSVIHISFVLLCSFYNIETSFFYLIVYISYMFFFFFILSTVLNINIWYFTDLQFIFKNSFLSTALFIFFLGLSGMPPFFGFFAKMSIISLFLLSQDYLLFFLSIVSSLFIAFFYIQNYRFYGFNLKTINYQKNNKPLSKNNYFYFLIFFFIYLNIFSILYVGDIFIFIGLFFI